MRFGLRNMGVTHAGDNTPNTGHHHLLIDVTDTLSNKEPIPSDKTHLHFGAGQTEAIRAFLAEHGAKPTTIPYRANRAVIFDSDLFHETDAIRFQDGYANRRINVTMLYGWRHRGG